MKYINGKVVTSTRCTGCHTAAYCKHVYILIEAEARTHHSLCVDCLGKLFDSIHQPLPKLRKLNGGVVSNPDF